MACTQKFARRGCLRQMKMKVFHFSGTFVWTMVSKNVVPWMGSNFTPYLPSYFGDTDNMLSLAGNRLTDVIFALTLLFFFSHR